MEKVNINRAGSDELQKIIHIGVVRSNKIIHHRYVNGKFKDIYELSQILGFGSKRMDDIINQGIATV